MNVGRDKRELTHSHQLLPQVTSGKQTDSFSDTEEKNNMSITTSSGNDSNSIYNDDITLVHFLGQPE